MSRRKKLIRNVILLVFLAVSFTNRYGLYLTPLSAHEHSERSIHYGPSEVVHIEEFEKGKYILCRYDKWISCNTVNKAFLFFWRFGNQPVGFEYDKAKAIDYDLSGSSYDSEHYYKLYGIINDPRIERIDLIIEKGEAIKQTNFYDNLFLFTWKPDNYSNQYFDTIKGYDADNNIIFKSDKIQ